jgi:hypothetical protein
MKSLLDLIKALYGSKAIASTIGSKTNVIRLPSGKLQKYVSKDLNIEAASDAAAQNAYNEMKELIPEVAKMNDAERLIFEGNLRRLKNKLESSGAIEGENIPSGIVSIQSKIDQLKQAGKELEKITGEKATLTDVLKDLGTSQTSLSRMRDEGLVRATARQILVNDIKAGKIKNITVEEAINMGEPLDPFRQIYGEGALEQLDSLIPNLRNLKTEMEAEKLARSKFKFEPDENRLPGSVSIEEGRKAEQEFGINKPAKVSDFKAEATRRTSVDDLIDEYNANQDRLLLTDDEGGTLITYPEYNRLRDRNEEIAKVLEEKGIRSTPEVETKPEGIVIPFKKKPEEFAIGGRVGFKFGSGKKIIDAMLNANKLKAKHKDAFKAHDQINVDINDKIAPDMIAETMAEMKGKDYFSLSQKEQLNYYQKALAYVDDLRMIKKESTISPSIEIEQAMQEGIQKTNKMIGLGLDPSKSKDYDKFLEMQSIQQKYGNMIDDNLLKQIMVDDNPQRKAEVLATIDEAMKMQEKGMSPQEIIDIIKNTTRTKQAKGGSAGLDYLMGL